ncbi:MAG: PASTA domain-containing protein [Balneolaceae bacterium]|nr:PASTA domain-containing protein [Balneolaceae bacterium]
MFNQLKNLLTSKKLYYTIAGLVVAGIAILLLMNEVLMPEYTNYNEGVTVPDVTRMSMTEAEQMLQNYGLRYEVTDRRANAAYPANYIIDQTPYPSEIVKPNRKIYLTVNTGSRPTVMVPDVVNLSLRNAKIQLQNYGLEVGTVSFESSRFKNTVLRQSIESGRKVERGTVVNLAVSDGLGEKVVEVPDIIGLNLTEAQLKLREAGLRVEEIRFRPSKEEPPNVILEYTPKKDTLIEGESLKLIVSERFDVKEESESGAIRVDTTYVDDPDSTRQNNNRE